MSIREKSIQLAREREAKVSAARKAEEEKRLNEFVVQFHRKFGEYPDRSWYENPYYYARKEDLTFKCYFAGNNLSNGIEYFYITNPTPPYVNLSENLRSLTDLGEFLDGRKDSADSQETLPPPSKSSDVRHPEEVTVSDLEKAIQEFYSLVVKKETEPKEIRIENKPKRMLRF